MFRREFGLLISACAVIAMPFVANPARAGDCRFGWSPEQEVDGIESAVSSLVLWDPDGAGPEEPMLIAGGWTKIPAQPEDQFVGGVSGWNGTCWQTIGSAMNHKVSTLAVYDGQLICGGSFTSSGSNSLSCVAYWDGTGWQSLGGGVDASMSQPRVLSLLNHSGVLFVGGAFTSAGAQEIRRIAAWNGQSWQPLGTGLGAGAVGAIAVYDGEIIVGGGFSVTFGGGTVLNHVARWIGGMWQPLPGGSGVGTNGTINALTVYNGRLIAGGSFTTAGGSAANSIAQWDGADWSPLGGGVGGDNSVINALAVYDGRLIVGGLFTLANGQPADYVAQWDGNTWQSMGTGANRKLLAITVLGGEAIAGGFFTNIDESETARLARWRPNCGPGDSDRRGDMDCNGTVDQADTPLFVAALVNVPSVSPCEAWLANMNADIATDGSPRIDGADVISFVQAVLSP